MREVVAAQHLSLDGVMQAPARADEDPLDAFAHGGWAAPLLAADPDAARLYARGFDGLTGFLLGRRTYDDLVGHWLDPATGPNPFADTLRTTRKHVCARDADVRLPHSASHPLIGGAAETVAALKASGDGRLVVMGSGALGHAHPPVAALPAADQRPPPPPLNPGAARRLHPRAPHPTCRPASHSRRPAIRLNRRRPGGWGRGRGGCGCFQLGTSAEGANFKPAQCGRWPTGEPSLLHHP